MLYYYVRETHDGNWSDQRWVHNHNEWVYERKIEAVVAAMERVYKTSDKSQINININHDDSSNDVCVIRDEKNKRTLYVVSEDIS